MDVASNLYFEDGTLLWWRSDQCFTERNISNNVNQCYSIQLAQFAWKSVGNFDCSFFWDYDGSIWSGNWSLSGSMVVIP